MAIAEEKRCAATGATTQSSGASACPDNSTGPVWSGPNPSGAARPGARRPCSATPAATTGHAGDDGLGRKTTVDYGTATAMATTQDASAKLSPTSVAAAAEATLGSEGCGALVQGDRARRPTTNVRHIGGIPHPEGTSRGSATMPSSSRIAVDNDYCAQA